MTSLLIVERIVSGLGRVLHWSDLGGVTLFPFSTFSLGGLRYPRTVIVTESVLTLGIFPFKSADSPGGLRRQFELADSLGFARLV